MKITTYADPTPTVIKRAEDVIAVAKRRGFDVLYTPGPPPMPILRDTQGRGLKLGTPELEKEATAALMDALRVWRLEIIELVKGAA